MPMHHSVQHAAAAAPVPAPSPSDNANELVRAFTAAFTSDDVESFYKLIAPEAEWVIMATGETFRGLDQIKQLTVRSVAELPIILVGEIREGKIIKMREYFDLLTLTEAGTPHRLYS